MNAISHRIARGLLLLSGFAPLCADAASLDVTAFTVVKIYPGQYYDSAIVRSNGILVMNGGAIGTNPPVVSPSVTIQQGGKFFLNDGAINDFENDGVVEFYGGRQSTDSSVNRGYVKLAGGDPGIQLIHWNGTVDVYYLATNRTAWEIDSEVTNGTPAIRIFSLTNALAAGNYTYATLPSIPFPPGRVHTNFALLWNPKTNRNVRTDIIIKTNWPGSVTVQTYTQLPPHSITCAVRRTAFVEVSWNSASGRTYQVQDALNLSTQDWENTSTPTSSTGATSLVNDVAFLSNRFYRVLLRH